MLKRTTAVVLMATVVIALVATTADAGKLFPKCNGQIFQAYAPYIDGVRGTNVMNLTGSPTEYDLNCIAFEVLPRNPLNTQCLDMAGQSQVDLPYDIVLVAKTETNTYRWNVDDTVGGSVEHLKFSVHQEADWSMEIVNRHHAHCEFTVRMVVVADAVHNRSITEPAPGLILISPTTIYRNRKTVLAFKVVGNPTAQDSVRVKRMYLPPGETAEYHAISRINSNSVRDMLHLHDASVSLWEFEFPEGGNYKVEYRMGSPGTYHEIAHIIAYGGNPAFFTIGDGAGPEGQIFLDVRTTMIFHGDNLDARARTGDQAKFVAQSDSCSEAAAPAGGVSAGTDLGPGESYGYNTSMTYWDFTLTVGGTFRVCYKRAGGDWAEIVSRDDLPDLGPATAAPPGSVPVPTNAAGNNCSLAPPRDNPPTYETFIVIRLRSNQFTFYFRNEFARFLCIPPDVIAVMDMQPVTRNSQQMLEVTIDIVCNLYGRSERCSGAERKDYLLYSWYDMMVLQTRLFNMGVDDVKEIAANGVIAENEAQPGYLPQSKSNVAVAVVVCLTVLGIVGMGVFAFVRHHQHRFIQVGHDTVEDDEKEIRPRADVDPERV